MTTSLHLISDAWAEPIDMETARLHLRVDAEGSPPVHPDDPLIALMLTAAREQVETFTGLQLATRLWELRGAAFADSTDLPLRPVRYVAGIEYVDPNGAEQTLDESVYTFDPGSPDGDPPRVRLADGQTWPETRGRHGDVSVLFTTGYSEEGDSPAYLALPASLRAAMLLILGHLYDHRADVNEQQLTAIPNGAEHLMRPYRRLLGMA